MKKNIVDIYFNEDVRKRLRKKIKEFKTQKAAADNLSITPQYLSDMVNGRRDFSKRILTKLGLENCYIDKH